MLQPDGHLKDRLRLLNFVPFIHLIDQSCGLSLGKGNLGILSLNVIELEIYEGINRVHHAGRDQNKTDTKSHADNCVKATA